MTTWLDWAIFMGATTYIGLFLWVRQHIMEFVTESIKLIDSNDDPIVLVGVFTGAISLLAITIMAIIVLLLACHIVAMGVVYSTVILIRGW